jgi:hypothetical protein
MVKLQIRGTASPSMRTHRGKSYVGAAQSSRRGGFDSSSKEQDMKHLALAIAVLTVSAGSALAAGSPFDGTWKLNMEKSKFTGTTITYTKTAHGYRYSNGATVSYAFGTDGKDYPAIADRTTAWTPAGEGAWDTVFKANGKVLSKSHRALSADGKTLTVATTLYRNDGTTTQETDVYNRVSGAKGLAGEWRDTKAEGGDDTMTITTPAAGKFMIVDPTDKETVTGSTNGSPAKIDSPSAPPGLMVAYKAVGHSTWDTTTKIGDKVYAKGSMTVSADGKTLKETTWVPGKEAEKSVSVYDKQ